jgi:hypothetical protein
VWGGVCGWRVCGCWWLPDVAVASGALVAPSSLGPASPASALFDDCPQVENWISEAGADYVSESWDELKYIRQAVTFLVISNKPEKSLDEITHDLCPVLSIQQVRVVGCCCWRLLHAAWQWAWLCRARRQAPTSPLARLP